MTRSIASSSSSMSMRFLPWRAASSAASFTRLARSAPVKPGRAAREHLEVDVVGERLAPGVDLEDAEPALEVGAVHDDLAVEAARTQQRRVEDVGPVGRRDQDDVVLDVEAVHLDEQLVERLLALVVTAAETGAALTTDRVDLVHEDDARSGGLGLLEQVAHARRADADEHLDEVGAGDREERHGRLAGDRTREQRLAGARRAYEQHALGDLGAERLELAGVGEELLDLLELLDRLVDSGDVLECDPRLVARHALRLGLAERHDLGVAALHLVHEEEHEADEQDDRQQRSEMTAPG